MTNGWIDIKNTDMMLIMGGNPAENHPCGFKWPIEAKRVRNAKMIVVDPRFTRTASVADHFVQIRAGSDIAFLGGIVNYALQNNRINKEYVVNYTNAALIVQEGFKLPDNIDGVFSGYDPVAMTYKNASWNYEEGGDLTPKGAVPIAAVASTLVKPPAAKPAAGAAHAAPAAKPAKMAKPVAKPAAGATPPAIIASLPANTAYDLSLTHPRCVYQLLKQHFSRYTPEMVASITGAKADAFTKAADMYTSVRKDGDTKKVGTIIYSVGWTQHTVGAQIIRTAAIIQLLLGNVGRAGGGVNALRGHSNIQGATDMAGIWDNLPGYLKVPVPADTTLDAYLARITLKSAKPKEWDSFNYWSNTPKFAVSLLKALYGDKATPENEFAFHYLPKADRKYSWVEIWDGMYNGKVKGLMAWGMNGVAIGPNSQKNIDALKKADWLVVCDIYPEETSSFWEMSKEDEQKKIMTSVYRLPGAGFAEKDGTFVNSARWLKWKYAALPTPGDAKLDHEILARIFLKVQELYKKEGGKFPDPILNVSWAYNNRNVPSFTEMAKEINGKALADLKDANTGQEIKTGQQVPGFAWLKDDGSTSCANWLYAGSWTEAGSQAQRRGLDDPGGLGTYPSYAWSWPANRRVLYNRASCNIDGKPWDPDRRQVWWNDGTQRWAGNDVPDIKVDAHPKDHMGPFIMTPEGMGRLFVPLGGMADGPFPEHYEPMESPTDNLFHPKQANNPVVKKYKTDKDKYAVTGSKGGEFDVVCTTYRLTEHYHYWTKNNPANVQLVPEPFIEISEDMANDRGIKGGDKLKVSSARGEYYGKAMVTKRIKSLMINNKKVYPIGIPIHWAYKGIREDKEDKATSLNLRPLNNLSPVAIDPNAYTPEFKGFLVKVEKA
ncbi:MAG TPA: formate dehydrogenase-N subunit alpha [Candidatus Saccharimonadales bacterium]|nr:formate dehydrogenase-N subunit alpha [Candidatus Saccharimonadales bacterium]